MENASKALIIAGSILLAVMVIGALVYMYSNLSRIPKQEQDQKRAEQLMAFNAQFEQYNNKTVYGVDLFSILNQIEDFNKRYNTENSDESAYSEIDGRVKFVKSISITLNTNTFTYNSKSYGDCSNKLSIGANVTKTVQQMSEVSEYVNGIKSKIESKYGSGGKKTISQLLNLSKELTDWTLLENEVNIVNPVYGDIDNVKKDIIDYTNISAYYSEIKNKKFSCEIAYESNGVVKSVNFTEKT